MLTEKQRRALDRTITLGKASKTTVNVKSMIELATKLHGYDGTYADAQMYYVDRAVPLGEVVCDFCSAIGVVRGYKARDIILENPPDLAALPIGLSQGDWAACKTCAPFIDCRDSAGLLRHCFETVAAHGVDLPIAVRYHAITTAQEAFWRAYTGVAYDMP